MDILLILRALRKNKVGAILIGLQVALTLAMVCNSLSVIQQFVERMQRASGIDEDNIFTLSCSWISDPADLQGQIKGDLAALRALPRCGGCHFRHQHSAGWSQLQLGPELKPDQRTPTASAATLFADEHGLATFGFKLTAGRWFNADEVGWLRYYENKYPPTLVVTQDLAKALFPSGNALGQVVFINSRYARIVGVIERAQTPGAANAPRPERSVFVPMIPLTKTAQYIVRTRPGQLATVMHTAQDKLFAVSNQRIIQRVTPFSETRQSAYLLQRTVAIMLGVVSALLLAVTGFGVVGLTTYWVSRRQRQIGMRRALGARKFDILTYFHIENLLIVAVGCVIGLRWG
ncbi:MAG: ABC transporter permease [Steroidobacteraceae bacterium]